MTEGTQPAGGLPPPGSPTADEPTAAPVPPVESMPEPVAPPPAQAAWPPPPVTAPPPAQAAWPPPPAGQAPPAAWPPAAPYAGAPAASSTSVLVVVAGIFLLIVGILTFGLFAVVGLLGGLVASVGTAETGLDIFGPLGNVIAGVAIVFVFWGLLEVVAAIGIFIHRGWGRALGLTVGVIGTLFMALVLVGVAGRADPDAVGLGFSLVLLAAYGVTVLALLTGGAHFRRRA